MECDDLVVGSNDDLMQEIFEIYFLSFLVVGFLLDEDRGEGISVKILKFLSRFPSKKL
jgi:hypothetical protein